MHAAKSSLRYHRQLESLRNYLAYMYSPSHQHLEESGDIGRLAYLKQLLQ